MAQDRNGYVDGAVMRYLTALLFTVAALYGAACSTTGTGAGNYSNAAVWTNCNGGVPGIGDTIASWARPITVDVNTTVGDSPADSTSATIQVANGGSVIIASGVTFTVRGNIKYAAQTAVTYVLDMLSSGVLGSSLVFDPTQATSPTTAAYTIGPSVSNPGSNSRFRSVGTAIARNTIKTLRTNGNEAQAAFSRNGFSTSIGYGEFYYTDFTDLGSASVDMYQGYLGSTAQLIFDHCEFNRTGRLQTGAVAAPAGATVKINYSKFISSPGVSAQLTSASGAQTAPKEFIGNYVSGTMTNQLPYGYTIRYNVFEQGFGESITATNTSTVTWDNNVVIVKTAPFGSWHTALYKDTFMLHDWNAVEPDEFLFNSTVQNITFDGVIAQLRNNVQSSDNAIFATSSGQPGMRHTFKNCIVLRASDPTTGLPRANSSGVFIIGIAAPTHTMALLNNTYAGGPENEGGVWLNHPGYSMPTGLIDEMRSNLYWDTSVRGKHVYLGSGSGTPNNDIVLPATATNNATYNGGVSTEAGSTGSAYDIPTTSMPGANDAVGQNPWLVDPDRNFEKYAEYKGQARSYANTLAILAADPVTEVPLFLAYIRQGSMPQNPRMWSSGYNGTYVGAVDPSPLKRLVGASTIQ